LRARSHGWRRLAAGLAGAALLLLGAPLHQHLGAGGAPTPAIEAGAATASGAHPAACPACQTHARSRGDLARPALVALTPPALALRLPAPRTLAALSAAAAPPTPPRGPPSPTT
jgi:hypothetical protein